MGGSPGPRIGGIRPSAGERIARSRNHTYASLAADSAVSGFRRNSLRPGDSQRARHRRNRVALPLNDAIVKADHVTWEHYGVQPTWRTFRDYFAGLGKQGMGINLASYVGATQVRRVVLGDDDRAPSPEELEQMKALVRDAMREGAVAYAKTHELIALAGEAAKFGGTHASHIRDEGDAIIPALEEAFRIGLVERR